MARLKLKKKVVVFLVTVALGGGAMVVRSARSATDSTGLDGSKSGSKQQADSEGETGSLFGNDADFGNKSSYDTGSGELFVRAMLAVLFVVALGAAAVYASKKLLPKLTNLPGKEIRVIETVHLGPRKAVHVLEIGGRRLLIGSTNENVTKLADITDGFGSLSAQEIQP